MQSDTSSPKRSASEGPYQDSPPQSSHSRKAVHDIDANMNEQEDGATLEQPLSSSRAVNGVSGPKPMSGQEKIEAVDSLKKLPMSAGETWYVVSRAWYRRWEKACTGQVDKDGPVEEKDIGPVDNSGIIDKDGNLLTSVVEGIDVEFVPKSVWEMFTSWYGKSEHPLPRPVILRGYSRQPYLEIHVPRFRVFRITAEPDPSNSPGSPIYVSASSQFTVKELFQRFRHAVAPNESANFTVYRIESDDLEGRYCTPSQLTAAQAQKVAESDETIEASTINSGDTFAVEIQGDGSLASAEATQVTAEANSDEDKPLFGEGSDFFGRLAASAPKTQSTTSIGRTASGTSSLTMTKPSSALVTTPSTSRVKSSQEPGTLGLGNMGNTCFMNSALQCLAHTKELTDYFLTGVYQDELNPDNPLGMHGAIAEAFGALLQRIWAMNPTSTSYSPREFKQALQRFAPQFSGYQQHDSQELVAFLLDGLHEDLNRIKKKPYVEKPDWEGGGDKELVELAKKSWEGYLLRNDSVIVDLFQGQYRSTLVCPECQKVSITFDPFMYLTLPLPVKKKWRHEIYYVPWDINKPHVKVPVEINRDSSFRELRQLLARWMGSKAENLLTLEIFSHRFYKSLDDNCLCGDVSDSDTIVCFELPCPSQQSPKYKRKPGDPFIIPVFLCDITPSRQSYGRTANASLFGYPFVAVITEEQARDLDSIYAAVVERLSRWTANARHLYTWEEGPADEMEEVPITLTGFPPVNPVAEVKVNGDIVTVEEEMPEEGDIVDEKSAVVDDDIPKNGVPAGVPKITGPKKDVFNFRLQVGHNELGTGYGSYGSQHYVSWEKREEAARQATPEDPNPVLLQEGDAFFCEFDENMKAFFFGDQAVNWEHALWMRWEDFVHPEYEEARKNASEKKTRGISIQDCLAEFTREEQLGEDDLWYCPRCKKHQQATKKFDLWSIPDVLVVHLKRFSNSRMLRDKIDAFVDFPVEGLDLTDLAGERQVAKSLQAQGLDVSEFGDLDEPLVYDLYAVDEHLGGLGGGHYRAYAYNHVTNKWYHFDDSYVTPARPTDAVNQNAYLLFYKRRTNRPLGGKTHAKIEEARSKPHTSPNASQADVADDVQLPTPPDEVAPVSGMTKELLFSDLPFRGLPSPALSSSASSPPPLDDVEPPSFDDAQFDDIVQTSVDPLVFVNRAYDFPNPSSHPSPSSSNDVEVDEDERMDPWIDPFPSSQSMVPDSKIWDVNYKADEAQSPLPGSDYTPSDISPDVSASDADPVNDQIDDDFEPPDISSSHSTRKIRVLAPKSLEDDL
ncbi:UCH-domain-containing protein [Gloeophyllum trabeum ATCC 11539]|uniref:ubiquitinyl hydrolase 1 n=1 Tax=Gloeophyllum trabeum (strain ATCC 11539 / FP-39264 / Madison 617) TaxID=670483 RepID=S7RT98_GLOTA|nr:UCH-domain-containing protein [Gloeophyllum trabeum ATCC 11539]EPQ56354.1 UCH-domain-containing protein [Gloeophyllum trabeum ATCC 11539]